MLTWGILPRMGLLAAGWTRPGDNLRRADDRAWWAKTYAHPLWAPLETYAIALDRAGLGNGVQFDSNVASADPAALSERIAMVADDLAAIQADRSDTCAPYIIPNRVGVLPVDNIACQTALRTRKPLEDGSKQVFGNGPIPWWAWVVIGFYVTRKVRS